MAKRLGYVDGLRALAALTVLVTHTTEWVWGVSLPSGPLAALNPVLLGHAAVAVFIVLSGYSLMLPVARNANRIADGALGFYWRRVRRILPPYYAAFALAFALIALGVLGQRSGSPWDSALVGINAQTIIEHLALLQDVSPINPGAISPALWSVALECHIYLLFPALVWLWRRYHPLFVTASVTLVSCLLALALVPTPLGRTPGYLVAALAPQFLGLFVMGMLGAHLTIHPPRWRWGAQGWRWLALGCVALISLAAAHVGIAELDPVSGALALAVLMLAARPGLIRAALEWRPLVWIGGFSYSLYLVHVPLLQLIWQYGLYPLGLGDVATYLLLLFVGGPLIVLAAWGFHLVAERPFMSARPAAQTRAAGRLTGGNEATRPLETEVATASTAPAGKL